jgi:SAM-dependent methyltransferase
MHPSCLEWVGQKVREWDLAHGQILEVGSYDVNGTVRPHFDQRHYVGVDMQPGPGVDETAIATDLPWGPSSFDVVVSTEMLEHCDRPWVAVAEMARVLRPGGYLILTARGYDERGCWEVHGYPEDFYRFSARAMETLLDLAGLRALEITTDPEGPGWFCLASKP